jgi:hypothetical protein
MRKILIYLSLGFILGILVSFLFSDLVFTGRAIDVGDDEKYSYTTGICNKGKECIDIVVHCEGDKIAKLEPISDLKSFGENWTDPRNQSELSYCE